MDAYTAWVAAPAAGLLAWAGLWWVATRCLEHGGHAAPAECVACTIVVRGRGPTGRLLAKYGSAAAVPAAAMAGFRDALEGEAWAERIHTPGTFGLAEMCNLMAVLA